MDVVNTTGNYKNEWSTSSATYKALVTAPDLYQLRSGSLQTRETTAELHYFHFFLRLLDLL